MIHINYIIDYGGVVKASPSNEKLSHCNPDQMQTDNEFLSRVTFNQILYTSEITLNHPGTFTLMAIFTSSRSAVDQAAAYKAQSLNLSGHGKRTYKYSGTRVGRKVFRYLESRCGRAGAIVLVFQLSRSGLLVVTTYNPKKRDTFLVPVLVGIVVEDLTLRFHRSGQARCDTLGQLSFKSSRRRGLLHCILLFQIQRFGPFKPRMPAQCGWRSADDPCPRYYNFQNPRLNVVSEVRSEWHNSTPVKKSSVRLQSVSRSIVSCFAGNFMYN
ncbi:hypothetical protein EVAR_22534_1 [Eumeta japonica]|uniref:Uncharacterized protein n=1 Tax=Eumeta variegata TaxID=151549 RepID=A0A4C1U7I3_EUMVA|nr:hypothetical protein EVAR_22534_1 [Eumeta japonica]